MRTRWESPTRYYTAELYQDLLGDRVLVPSRGGRSNRLGALRIMPVNCEQEGLKRLRAMGQLRERHGYLKTQARPYGTLELAAQSPDQNVPRQSETP